MEPIIRHTSEYSDAYLDISYYVPPHQYTPAEIEMYLISPRPQFPPHEAPRPVREYLIVSDLDDWFEDILDEAGEEIEIEVIADPIAHRDIVSAFFNATNIDYRQKKKRNEISPKETFVLRRTLKIEAPYKLSERLVTRLTKKLLCCKLDPPLPPNLMSKMKAEAVSEPRRAVPMADSKLEKRHNPALSSI